MQPRQDKQSNTLLQFVAKLRESYAQKIRFQFTDDANKKFFWDSLDSSVLKPIQKNDPYSVKLAKHGLLVLQDAEYLIQVAFQYKKLSYLGKKSHLIGTAVRVGHRVNTSFIVHLNALYDAMKEANITETIPDKFNAFVGIASDLVSGNLTEEKMKILIEKDFSRLADFALDVFRVYYQKIGSKKPIFKNHDDVIIQESKEPNKSLLPQTNKSKVFPMDAVRSGVAKVTYFCEVLDRIYQHEIKSDDLSKPRRYMMEVKLALSHPSFDDSGYVCYDIEKDVPFVQSIKALFNIFHSIHILSRDIQDRVYLPSKIVLAGRQSKGAYDHYKKIDIKGMNEDAAAFFMQLVQSVMIFCRDVFMPGLSKFADEMYEFEMNNHFRYGAFLSGWPRQIFDSIELVYIKVGVAFENPFSYSELREEMLDNKIKLLDKQRHINEKKMHIINHTCQMMDDYIDGGDVTAKMVMLSLLRLQRLSMIGYENHDIHRLEDQLIMMLSEKDKRELQTVLLYSNDVAANRLRSRMDEVATNNFREITNVQMRSVFSRNLQLIWRRIQRMVEPWPSAALMNTKRVLFAIKQTQQQALLNTVIESERHVLAMSELRQMGKRFALHYLERHGLIGLLQAAQDAPNGGSDASSATRLLTVIFSRLRYVKKSTLTSLAVDGSTLLRDCLEELYDSREAREKSLACLIAWEVTLGGFVDVSAWRGSSILLFEDHEPLLATVLPRLSGKTVVRIVTDSLHHHQPSYLRLKLLLSLLNQESITKEDFHLDVLAQYVHAISDEKSVATELIESIVDCYQRKVMRDSPQLPRKIGVFLGHLAHADTEIAKIVFANQAAKQLLFDVCLPRRIYVNEDRYNRALYADSFISSLYCRQDVSVTHYHLQDVRARFEYRAIVKNQMTIILAISQMVNGSSHLLNENNIFKYYPSPLQLCNMLLHFITEYLSRGSAAEKMICDLLTNIAMCQGGSGWQLRKEILTTYSTSLMREDYSYVKWIERSQYKLDFWLLVKNELVIKAKKFIQSIDECYHFASSDMAILMHQSKVVVEEALKNLSSGGPLMQKCLFLYQEVMKAREQRRTLLLDYLRGVVLTFEGIKVRANSQLISFVNRQQQRIEALSEYVDYQDGPKHVFETIQCVMMKVQEKQNTYEADLQNVVHLLVDYMKKQNRFIYKLIDNHAHPSSGIAQVESTLRALTTINQSTPVDYAKVENVLNKLCRDVDDILHLPSASHEVKPCRLAMMLQQLLKFDFVSISQEEKSEEIAMRCRV